MTRLTLSLLAGAGLGRLPRTGLPGPAWLSRLAGAAPDDAGGLVVGGDGCAWARPVVDMIVNVATGERRARPRPGTLALGNDCQPCRRCGDVAATQRAVVAAWGELRAAAETLEAARLAYVELVERWEEERACRAGRAVHLDAVASGRRIDVAASICNHTEDCLYEATVRVAVQAESPPWLDPERVSRTDGPGVARAYALERPDEWTYVAHWHRVLPGEDAVVRFSLEVPPLVPARGTMVRLEASATAGGSPWGSPPWREVEIAD